MCVPLAVGALGVTVKATALQTGLMALSAGTALAGQYGKTQQASAINKQRAKLQAKQQQRVQIQHAFNLGEWYHKHIDAEYAWAENLAAENRGAWAEQAKLNEGIAQIFAETAKDHVTLFSKPDVAKSFERSGQSAKRVETARDALIGRRKAERWAKQDQLRDRAKAAFIELKQRKDAANRRAERIMGYAPQRGMMPDDYIPELGPSGWEIGASVAQGLMTGYMAGDKLSPTNAIKGGGD